MGSRQLQLLLTSTVEPPLWGVSDCAMFAADVSRTYTGVDPFSLLRGKWSSEREAVSFWSSRSHDRLEAGRIILKEIGLHEIPPDQAVSGDVGLVQDDKFKAVFACRIEAGWILRMERGFGVVPSALVSWSLFPSLPYNLLTPRSSRVSSD